MGAMEGCDVSDLGDRDGGRRPVFGGSHLGLLGRLVHVPPNLRDRPLGRRCRVPCASKADVLHAKLCRLLCVDVFSRLVVRFVYTDSGRILSRCMAGEPHRFIRPLWPSGAFVESGLASRQRRSLRLPGAGLAETTHRSLLSEGLLDCACIDDTCDGACVTIHMAYQTHLKLKNQERFYFSAGAEMDSLEIQRRPYLCWRETKFNGIIYCNSPIDSLCHLSI